MNADLALVDHHCHGIVAGDLDRPAFEALLSEGGAPAEGVTNFDTPLGLAVRRHCAPVLDLAPHADPDAYLAARARLGAGEVARRLLDASGIDTFLVDTGFRGDELTTPPELAEAAGGTAYEIVRLESVAEALAAERVEPDAFAAAYADRLAATVRETGAVGVKSIAAYRVGFDFDPSPPGPDEVTAAVARWQAATRGTPRLADPVLTRLILWTGVDLGLPIQFHVGYGDPDIRLHRADPTLLTDFLHAVPHRVPVMLLHCYPYHRNAGYLAAVHPHVYLDVGLALGYAGPARGRAVLEEALELAPFGKMLFSTDAFGLPELYHLGALVFRRALGALLDERVAAGEWSPADAERIAYAIGAGNARRVYGLPGEGEA